VTDIHRGKTLDLDRVGPRIRLIARSGLDFDDLDLGIWIEARNVHDSGTDGVTMPQADSTSAVSNAPTAISRARRRRPLDLRVTPKSYSPVIVDPDPQVAARFNAERSTLPKWVWGNSATKKT